MCLEEKSWLERYKGLDGPGCVPIKVYLQRQLAGGLDLACGPRLAEPCSEGLHVV